MPRISVIMPVYNTKTEYFKEAVESILAQTYTDFELIIVDDCSKDYIKEIVLSYSDKRIRYYRMSQNSGAAAARNFAISKAQGEFLAFMDSDDISLPSRFEEQIDFFENNPQIGCLGTEFETIGDADNKGFSKQIRQHEEITQFLLFTGCAFCQSTVMLRKEILDKNNIRYNVEYVPSEDYALWLDLIGKTQFAILDKTLVKYRFYAENISNCQQSLQKQKGNEAQLNALRKYLNFEENDKNLLTSFLQGNIMSPQELQKLAAVLRQVFELMERDGFILTNATDAFHRKFKNLYYHTHGIKGQWQLFTSPLNKILKLPFSMRLMCLITRGIL